LFVLLLLLLLLLLLQRFNLVHLDIWRTQFVARENMIFVAARQTFKNWHRK
jgi:hypothetical protein